jgi:hypothetical protein
MAVDPCGIFVMSACKKCTSDGQVLSRQGLADAPRDVLVWGVKPFDSLDWSRAARGPKRKPRHAGGVLLRYV